MELNGFWQVVIAGCFGGLLAESVKWYRLRERRRLPLYAKSPRYWIITVIMALLGGILSAMYGVVKVNAIMAVNLGASAPLIISSLANTLPTAATRTVPQRPYPVSIINFLSGR